MGLTQVEKIAGRAFRDSAQAALTESLATEPPFYKAPNFLSHWRHECPGNRGISMAIALKERYVMSPAYLVDPDAGLAVLYASVITETEPIIPKGWEFIPAGRFGFVYKEGRCSASGCARSVRSPAGKVVDAYQRPPIEGRVARR